MQHVPETVIARLAIFADSVSLVKLAATCHWLWWRVGAQQRIWWLHFRANYPEEDDREMAWLRWYIRRTSFKINENTSLLGPYELDWFQAYCRRTATETRWFKKNEHYHLVSTSDTPPSPYEYQVLQRLLVHRITLRECAYLEQCQSLASGEQLPTWHLRRFQCLGVNPDTEVWQIQLSSSHIVASVRSTRRDHHTGMYYTADILVWPVGQSHRLAPYCIPGLWSKSFDLRGHWLLLTDIQEMNSTNQATWTRVYNLHTRQWCAGNIEGKNITAFFQKVDQLTATVLHVDISVDTVKQQPLLNWSVWQFHAYFPTKDARCLAVGECCLPKLVEGSPPIRRLDDDRAFIGVAGISIPEPSSVVIASGKEEADKKDTSLNPITLGVLSNLSGYAEVTTAVKLKPDWSQLVEAREFIPMIARQQLLLTTNRSWTVLDLTNGTPLRVIEMNFLDQWFSKLYWRNLKRRMLDEGSLIDSRAAHRTTTGKIAILDLLQPERIRELVIPDEFTSYGRPALCGGSANALIVKLGEHFMVVDAS